MRVKKSGAQKGTKVPEPVGFKQYCRDRGLDIEYMGAPDRDRAYQDFLKAQSQANGGLK